MGYYYDGAACEVKFTNIFIISKACSPTCKECLNSLETNCISCKSSSTSSNEILYNS